MKFPQIITNFKAYDSGFGDDAVRMAKIHEKVAKETGVAIGIAVSAIDLSAIASVVDIPVFIQHVDSIAPGRGTGGILVEAAKKHGAYGTLLNHSERRLPREIIKLSVERAKSVGLHVVLCAESSEEVEIFKDYGADMIALEPPELIGGDISVSTASPEIIDRAVQVAGRGLILVGAGIKDSRDVRIARELGAYGILVASGVMQSAHPEKVLLELAEGFL